MIDDTAKTSIEEAWSTTSRRRCCDSGMATKRESCGSLLGGVRDRWLGDRLAEEDRHVTEDQSVRNLAPAYAATDASAVPLCETLTASSTGTTELPGAGAVNRSTAATRAAASGRYSLPDGVSPDEALCRGRRTTSSRDDALCDAENREMCTGSTLESSKRFSTTNNCHFTTTVKAGSESRTTTRNRQRDHKHQETAMRYRRPGSPQLPLAVDEQTHRHHGSNGRDRATCNRMAEARISNRLIRGNTDDSIRNSSNDATEEMSAAGCIGLVVIAITAFAAGTLCGPPLGEQQALPIATPRVYTKNEGNFVISNRAPNTHNSRDQSFRWRRSLPGATARMPAWHENSQDSYECVTLPAAEVANMKPKGPSLSRGIGGWGGRETRVVRNNYSSSYRAHVASSLYTWQRDNRGKQQQGRGHSSRKQYEHCHASMPVAYPRSTVAVSSVGRVTPALKVPLFPAGVDLQEGRQEGVPHEVFSRVRMSSGSGCRSESCETSKVVAGTRQDVNGDDGVEIESRHKMLGGATTGSVKRGVFSFFDQALVHFGSRRAMDIAHDIPEDPSWRGSSSQIVAQWACNAMVSCDGFYYHGECSRCALWTEGASRPGTVSGPKTASQSLAMTTAADEGDQRATTAAAVMSSAGMGGLSYVFAALLTAGLQIKSRGATTDLSTSEDQHTDGNSQRTHQAGDYRSRSQQCLQLLVTGDDLPVSMSGYYHRSGPEGATSTVGVQPPWRRVAHGNGDHGPSFYFCQAPEHDIFPSDVGVDGDCDFDGIVDGSVDYVERKCSWPTSGNDGVPDDGQSNLFMSIVFAEELENAHHPICGEDLELTRRSSNSNVNGYAQTTQPGEDSAVKQRRRSSNSGHCLYWVNFGGGRWVLDDDLEFSNGVLGMTKEGTPELASDAFGSRSYETSPQGEGRGRLDGEPGTVAASSWLLDSPRLQTWVDANDVHVVCKTSQEAGP